MYKGSSRRFCKPHPMMLIQGDIKYGPFPLGKMVLPALTTIPDICCPHDFTIIRKNPSLRIPSIRPSPDMESLMPATLTTEASTLQSKSGSHQDLGSVSCMQNHVQKSKGKIEKFHQVVDDFIRESKLKNIRTLEELNRLWAVYLEEYYHKQKHAGIAEYYERLGSPHFS